MAKTDIENTATDRRKLKKPTLSPAQLEKLNAFFKRHRNGRTNVEIGKIANVTPSTITMALKGERVPSVKVIRQLAKVLRPATSKRSLEEFTDEFLKLASYEPSVVADVGLPDSVTKRLDDLRVAYVVNEPFVDNHWDGFAADLLDYVIDLIKGTVQRKFRCEPNQLQDVMEQREADLVVSVFPTFQRDAYMDFSDPFPYLRVPLTGLVRIGTEIEGSPLTLENVVNWTKKTEQLPNIKMLLVDSEVGHDFVKTFLKEANPTHYELADKLDPNAIYRQLQSNPNLKLFLANMVTCSGVYDLAKADFEYLPSDETLRKDEATGELEQSRELPVLAMYPMTFGLPEGDKDWKKMIDDALKSLMKEGAGLLVSLYKTYLENDRHKRFRASLRALDDAAVTYEPLRKMFRELFEAKELIPKPVAATAGDSQDKA
jgi:ABC-type amino acid transport substrate-binding protein